MKRIKYLLATLLVFVSCFISAGCGKEVNYDINFIVDNQNYATVSTSGDEIIKMPENPSKDSYTFNGWYWDNSVWSKPFTENSLLDVSLSNNMSVYAKWTAIEYTATFKADGKTVGTATYTVEDSTIKNAPSVPNKDGYDGVWQSYTIKAGGMTVNAVYTAKRYKITYSGTKGATNDNHTSYTSDTETFNLLNLSKEGYTFDGWYDGSTKVTKIEKGSYGNLSLEAKWTAIEYTATFKAGGKTVGTATYTVEDSTIKNVPSVPNKNGYDGAWENYTIKTGGMTVNAFYIAKQYTISYSNTKGVTNNNKTNYTPDTATFTLSNLSKEGYTFDGWYNGSTRVTKLENGSYGNLSLEAKWTVIEYTATFKADGKTVGTATYTVEDRAIKNVPSVPNKDGYDGAWETYTIKTGGMTVNAVYTAKQYTITWKDYDGSTLKISKCIHGQTPAYGTSPYRVGDYQYEYKFSGWSPAVTSAFEDATYTATYSQNKYSYYTIKYNMNGGNGTISSQTKKCGSETTLSSTIPTYEGHTFIGWNNIYENNIYRAGDSFSLDANVTLWAIWEENCEHCDGTGIYRWTSTCNMCSGTGTRYKCNNCGSYSIKTVIINYVGGIKQCNSCGSTSVSLSRCSWCNGKGSSSGSENCSYCNHTGHYGGEAPTASSVLARKIILNSIDGYEYSIDGVNYQLSTIFDNLKPNTSYTFYQRKATSGDVPFGCSSKGLSLTTPKDTTYYITYELNGGLNNSSNPTSYKTTGSSISLLNPTREYYDFAGWTYNGISITSINPSWEVDIVLVANWRQHEYSIEYDLDGGRGKNPTSYGIETKDIELVSPTKNGYTFLGWSGSNGSIPELAVTIPAESAKDLSYKANWSLDTYYITYNLNGGANDLSNPESYTVLDSTIILKAPTKAHYDFKGWNNENSTITRIYTSNAKNYVLTAIWAPHEYLITYDLDGGTGTNPTIHNVESNEIVLTEPTRDGYTFTGWTGSNGENPSTDVTIVSGNTDDLSYKANWLLNSYSITYVLNGGTNALKNPSSYTIEDTITLKDATKDYYTFEGWYKEPAFINKVETLNGQSGNLILHAKFTPYEFCANYDLNGGSSSLETCKLTFDFNLSGVSNKDVILKTGDSFDIYSIELPETNKVFLGWFDKPNYEFDSLISYNLYSIYKGFELKGDTTLYALWSDKELGTALHPGFSFNGYGDKTVYIPAIYSGVISISGYAGSSLNYIEFEHGYAATEYFPSSYSEFEYGPLTVMKIHNGSPSSYMKFTSMERRKVNVVYNEPTTKEYFGEAFSNPKSEREGYDFAGWYDENNELVHDTWDYTENKSFHAEWTIHNYSVTYNLNGGVNNSSNPSSFVCTDYIELLNPQKEGYTFDGWYSNSNFSNKVTHIDGSKYADIELFAKWISNTYVANLDYVGGQNCPTINFYSDGNIIKTIDLYNDFSFAYYVPIKEGYAFAGWYTDSSFTSLFGFNETVNKDLNLYAKWVLKGDTFVSSGTENSVSINGNVMKYLEIVASSNQTITIYSVSDMDLYGCVFDSNYNVLLDSDDISDDDLDFSITIVIEAGKKYYIGYKANQVSASGSATIIIGGIQNQNTSIVGSYISTLESVNVTYNSSFTLPVPKKDGFEFDGWYDANGNKINESCWNYAESITIYAHWKEKL